MNRSFFRSSFRSSFFLIPVVYVGVFLLMVLGGLMATASNGYANAMMVIYEQWTLPWRETVVFTMVAMVILSLPCMFLLAVLRKFWLDRARALAEAMTAVAESEGPAAWKTADQIDGGTIFISPIHKANVVNPHLDRDLCRWQGWLIEAHAPEFFEGIQRIIALKHSSNRGLDVRNQEANVAIIGWLLESGSALVQKSSNDHGRSKHFFEFAVELSTSQRSWEALAQCDACAWCTVAPILRVSFDQLQAEHRRDIGFSELATRLEKSGMISHVDHAAIPSQHLPPPPASPASYS